MDSLRLAREHSADPPGEHPYNQCICFQHAQVQQLKVRAAKEGQSALDADQRAKLATEDVLIEELRGSGGNA
jgi:hypothetical protein